MKRDEFLERIRKAVAEGNQAGHVAALPARGAVGYQGAGDDPVSRFQESFTAAGGYFHRAPSESGAIALLLTLLRERGCHRVLLGRGQLLDRLKLESQFAIEAFEVSLADVADRDTTFAADVGISGVDHLIAETGSFVVKSNADQPRGLSLLPPLHIALAMRDQLVPDLFDLFTDKLSPESLPACVVLITGPSKTGDIELRLVTGVHGPGEVHLLLLD